MVSSNQPKEEPMEEMEANETEFRNALFGAVEGANPSVSKLTDLFFRGVQVSEDCHLTPREQREFLLKIIASFHKGYARRFFAGLHEMLGSVINDEAFVPESAFDENGDEGEIEADAESTEALHFLKASTLAIQAHLEALVERRTKTDSVVKTYHVIDEIFACVEALHNILFTLQVCGDEGMAIQALVASLCEFWWNQRFVDRESMVVQLLPLLLAKSLDEAAKKQDIKRLFHVRDGLDVLDWKDESSRDMRELLLRTVSTPLFLTTIEGKRLISTFFLLDESLITDFHKAIRVQIPDAKSAVLKVYGEIYFTAWKESERFPEIRNSIEETALQDLMYAILHIEHPTTVKNLRTVLEKFHENKKTTEIESLLHRMYGPILWRSLTAANPRVRVNATMILAETFPLQDGISQADHAVHKGIRALNVLLVDIDPRVRVAAAAATAQILSIYWDVLPTKEIRTLMNHLVAKHASDKSSSAVRTGSLSAVMILLGAVESHAVLRPLLPNLGNLIHDKNERVRIAAVRLLQTIKSTQGIKYYHVVPVDHLLARLSDEGLPPKNPTNPVASGLTELMMNSYFPQGEGVTGAEQMKRTLSFLSSDPNAAVVFYANLASHLSVGSVAKLAAMLLRCLVAAVETDKARTKQGKKRGRQYGVREEEQDTESNGILSAADTSLMASVADTICCLWESIENQLQQPEHDACRAFLVDAFSGAVLGNVNSHFDAMAATFDNLDRKGAKAMDDCHRTCASILRCAGRLSSKCVEGLAAQITSKLASIDHDDQNMDRKNITPHIALLCMWGLTEDVSSSLASSIAKAFDNDDDLAFPGFHTFTGRSNKRKIGRGLELAKPVIPPLSPKMALSVFEEILSGVDPSCIAARTAILSSNEACNAFERALESGTIYAGRLLLGDPLLTQCMGQENLELVLVACEAYGRFALHKEATQKRRLGFSNQAKTLLDWTTNRILPAFLEAGLGTPLKDLNISRISQSSVSPVEKLLPGIMPPPRQRANMRETPDKYKTSFARSIGFQMDDTFVAESEELVRCAAKTLMQASCVIFSEWLAVGGSGAGVISFAAAKWCEIFSDSNTKYERQSELLPSFLRLAVQLCKCEGDFSVLRKLIVHCDELTESDEANLMKKSIAALLCSRDTNGDLLAADTVKHVLDAADTLIRNYGTGHTNFNEMPEALSDVWIIKKGYVGTCLAAIMSSKQGAVNLANELVSRLVKRYNETEIDMKAVFETQCLWLICGNTSICKSDALDVRKLLSPIDANRFAADCNLKTVVEYVLASAA